MVAITIPEDVTAHLEAAIRLSNRRVQMRLLQEAEAVLEQDARIAAVVIAFAVLESALESVPPERYPASAASIERWRALRDYAAHAPRSELTLEVAKEVVHGIRNLLNEPVSLTNSRQLEASITVNQLRGKYKYVPTSSAAFIQRKADEVDFEH